MLGLACAASGNGAPREIWVDHDGGWEDIAAIAILLRSPDIKVMGIATTPGIADAKTANLRLQQLLEALQIREMALDPKFPRGAEILATGPLTRVSQLIAARNEPKSITWMGGAVEVKGNAGFGAEWNAGADGGATRAVFASRVPLTICPLDLTNQFPSDASLAGSRLEELRKAYGEADRYFWDELAAASLVAPGLFERRTQRLVADQRGRIRRVNSGRPVVVLTKCDKAAFQALVAAALRF